MMSKKPIRKCVECGRIMRIIGRGRCAMCYKRMMKKNLPNDYVSPYIHMEGQGTRFKTGHKSWNKDKHIPEKQKQLLSKLNKGKNHPRYKHGEWITYNKQARKIVEQKIGRKLKTDETVHHLDGDIKNNDINNLCVFESQKAHLKHHWKEQKSKDIKGRMKKSKHET